MTATAPWPDEAVLAGWRAAGGKGLRYSDATIGKIRRNLFVFVTEHALEPTSNASERALRPCATWRKVTGGLRTTWGAVLYVDIRSLIETARRRAIPPLEAIALTPRGMPLPVPVQTA